MTEFNPELYKPTIDAILSVADLEQVSVKRIRKAIQELFVIDFDEKNLKKEVNELILARYHWLVDEQEKEKDRAEQKRKRKMEQADAKLAAELQGEGRGGRRKGVSSSTGSTPKQKKPRRSPAPGSNGISAMELNLSPKLQDILGVARLPRTQVVKKMWEYIKENDLQNPNDKREILCDEKMQEIFGKKMTMFSMNRLLSQQLYKDDE